MTLRQSLCRKKLCLKSDLFPLAGILPPLRVPPPRDLGSFLCLLYLLLLFKPLDIGMKLKVVLRDGAQLLHELLKRKHVDIKPCLQDAAPAGLVAAGPPDDLGMLGQDGGDVAGQTARDDDDAGHDGAAANREDVGDARGEQGGLAQGVDVGVDAGADGAQGVVGGGRGEGGAAGVGGAPAVAQGGDDAGAGGLVAREALAAGALDVAGGEDLGGDGGGVDGAEGAVQGVLRGLLARGGVGEDGVRERGGRQGGGRGREQQVEGVVAALEGGLVRGVRGVGGLRRRRAVARARLLRRAGGVGQHRAWRGGGGIAGGGAAAGLPSCVRLFERRHDRSCELDGQLRAGRVEVPAQC